jgi:hypothetical protein
MDAAVVVEQRDPRPPESFKRLDLDRINGVLHDTGDHSLNHRPP